jgi:DNA-binding HxlR family transcriptional regulator
MLKVTVDAYISADDCPFRNVLDKVGDKWSFLIFAVLEDGPKRFNEVERLIGDISHRVLARKRRDLEREGYLSRTVRATSPPHVEYALTELGRSLLEPIKNFLAWAQNTFPQVQKARAAYDQDTEKSEADGSPQSPGGQEPRRNL